MRAVIIFRPTHCNARTGSRYLVHGAARWLAALAAIGVSSNAPAGLFGPPPVQQSVVKIYATIQYPDYVLPWQMNNPLSATGSGFLIGKRRILTNAHVVSNARFLEVQKEGDPKRYAAEVAFVGHDCDLAILAVPDAQFFRGTRSLEIGDVMPSLNDEVTVVGYPMGGTRISVTRGVISRIDYGPYSHSGVDSHLVFQVDAAINPGNSGGPVMYRGRVAGMAFQVLSMGQNIGYAIPIPVLRHFLKDIEDGTYHGYPELGAEYLDLRNAALRKDLALPESGTGVVVYRIDPFGSAAGRLEARDVLMSIDGIPIANDGTILLAGTTVEFMELLERKQWGESITFQVWRNAAQKTVDVPLRNPADPFSYRNVYDKRPEYLIVGGLVFSPLTSEYLHAMGGGAGNAAAQQLLYYSLYAKTDGLYKERDEFVVLSNRLAHRVNTYDDVFMNGIVAEVNGRRVRNLREMKSALREPQNGFQVIRFEGHSNMLVMEARSAEAANAQILAAYLVPAAEYFQVQP